MLDSRYDVIRCLVTYADWWQPSTSSVLKTGAARLDKNIGDGLRAGLLETLDERTELCNRVVQLPEADRHLLFLWYVKQLHVDDVAGTLRLSRRQCFRRRTAAIKKIVDLGLPQEAA